MDEKPARKPRADKGVPRGPRAKAMDESTAPIYVEVELRNGKEQKFGCSRRFLQNGFHVFIKPSAFDPYRQTRTEIAVSEIVCLTVTEPEPFVHETAAPAILPAEAPAIPISAGPKIHNARQSAMDIMSRLETSVGPIKMDALPNMNVGLGDSAG